VEALVEKIPRGMVIPTPFLRNVLEESHFETMLTAIRNPADAPVLGSIIP
jgi:hypothetical protein